MRAFEIQNDFVLLNLFLRTLSVDKNSKTERFAPFAPVPLQNAHHYYETIRPCARYWYSRLITSFSLNTQTTGSHVPYISLWWVRAISIPATAWSVIGSPSCLSWRCPSSPVLTTIDSFSIPHQWFAFARLFITHLTFMTMPFLHRSLPKLFTPAAWSGLTPASESRHRGAYPHHIYSFSFFRNLTWHTWTKLLTRDIPEAARKIGINDVRVTVAHWLVLPRSMHTAILASIAYMVAVFLTL